MNFIEAIYTKVYLGMDQKDIYDHDKMSYFKTWCCILYSTGV